MRISFGFSSIRRSVLLPVIFILSFQTGYAQSVEPLKITDNGRYLEHQNGKPFFYLGDTAWELFHRLDREEAVTYLTNRKEKGFTVIQAVVVAQLGGLTDPNPYGDLPLIDKDPNKPNEKYFEHVDFIVNKAEELGLYIGMLPTWGQYWKAYRDNKDWIFKEDNAETFGRFLGNRYKDKPIIWILGGDANINSGEEHRIISAMAKGLREGDEGKHLITFHPRGPGMSSAFFHSEEWLDFNMYQSSHGSVDHDNGVYAKHDYQLKPVKPTLDGEPRYESIVVGFYFKGNPPSHRFTDDDSRQAAYWSLLAGACGHTYGNNNIWQMWQPGRGGAIDANIPWYEAIDHPGAFQMGHIRKLYESKPFTKLEPAQNMIVDGPKTGAAKICALLANDGSFAFVYSSQGEKFTIDSGRIKSRSVKESWYDPRYGVTYELHTTDNQGFQTYTPPTSGLGQDWILILEDANKNYPTP